jgi:hypothetical protein
MDGVRAGQRGRGGKGRQQKPGRWLWSARGPLETRPSAAGGQVSTAFPLTASHLALRTGSLSLPLATTAPTTPPGAPTEFQCRSPALSSATHLFASTGPRQDRSQLHHRCQNAVPDMQAAQLSRSKCALHVAHSSLGAVDVLSAARTWNVYEPCIRGCVGAACSQALLG